MAEADVLRELHNIGDTLQQMLRGSLSGNASGGMQQQNIRQLNARDSAEKAHMIRVEKALSQNASTLKEFSNVYNKQQKSFSDFAIASSLTATAIEQAYAASPLEELDTRFVTAFKDAMSGSKNSVVQQMGSQISSFTNVVEKERMVQQRLSFLSIQKMFNEHAITAEEYNDRIAAAGITAGQLSNLITRDFGELEEETMGLAKAMNEASKQIVDDGRSLLEWGKTFVTRYGFLGTGVAMLARELHEAGSAAAKFGTSMNVVESLLLGMSPAELSELQGKHKQTIMATNQSYDEFNTLLNQGNMELRGYTETLKAGAELNASALTTFRNLGGSVEGQAQYITDQQKLFKTWNRGFSTTSDQFNELNAALLNSQEFQASMYKLGKHQRKAAFDDIQMTYQHLKVQGMLHEEAMGVVSALNQISGTQDPKERMKQAARLQAYSGTLGMGEQGARAAELMRSGMRGAGEKEEFAKIAGEISKASSNQMQQGLAQELVHFSLLQKTGLDNLLGPTGVLAGAVTREGMRIDLSNTSLQAVAESMEGIGPTMTKLMTGMDILATTKNSPIWGAIATVSGGVWALVAKNGLGGTVGGAKGTAAAGARKGLAGLGKLIGFAGTAAAVGTLAYEVTGAIMEQSGMQKGLSNLLGLGPDSKPSDKDLGEEAAFQANMAALRENKELSRRIVELGERQELLMVEQMTKQEAQAVEQIQVQIAAAEATIASNKAGLTKFGEDRN